jgi:hypothetical protein
MMSDLEKKIIKEGTDAQHVYDEFAEWCEDKSRSIGFEIKTGKAQVAELKAKIEEETATIGAEETKIEELSSDISSNEADLKAATKVRRKEEAEFAAEEKELTEVISSLERATSILVKENAKGRTAMLQLKSAKNVVDALTVLVQASMLNSADATRLTALVQSSHQSTDEDSDEDSDMEPGAPAAAVYESKSGGIIATLEGLTEKAESQLEKARKEESTSKHNYEMLKQSLTDATKFATEDMNKAKEALAESQEGKASAEGDLETTSKDLAEDIKTKETLHQDCMQGAEEFELVTKSRGEELKAIAEAKKIVKETTSGAADQTYGLNQVDSFLQLSDGGAASRSVRAVRDLSRKFKATSLAQLASRMSSAIRLGNAGGSDPFAKVEGLIKDMIATLEAEAAADAEHHAYCEKEMSEAHAKKDDLEAASEKLSTKIDQDKAAATKLREQVSVLQGELASMAKAKVEATEIREKENADYKKNSAEMELGITGIRRALKVLKDYYSGDADHASNTGAGSGIIGLLEVCESDFTKGLTEMSSEEETDQANYEAYLKQDEIEVAQKEKDVKYKTQEAAALTKNAAELTNDLSSVNDELNAVNEGLKKLEEVCVAKAEPYEERKQRREDEIAGLKQALQTLDGDAVLLQRSSKHTLRGAQPHRFSA